MEGGAEPLCRGILQRVQILYPEGRDGVIYHTHHTRVGLTAGHT